MSRKSFAKTTLKAMTHPESIILLITTRHWEKAETAKTTQQDHFQITGCDLFDAKPEAEMITLALADFKIHAADDLESHDEITGYALLDLPTWKRLMPSTGERNTSEKEIDEKSYPVLRLCEHKTNLDKALAEAGISVTPYSEMAPDTTEAKSRKRPAKNPA